MKYPELMTFVFKSIVIIHNLVCRLLTKIVLGQNRFNPFNAETKFIAQTGKAVIAR